MKAIQFAQIKAMKHASSDASPSIWSHQDSKEGANGGKWQAVFVESFSLPQPSTVCLLSPGQGVNRQAAISMLGLSHDLMLYKLLLGEWLEILASPEPLELLIFNEVHHFPACLHDGFLSHAAYCSFPTSSPAQERHTHRFA